MRWSPTDRRSSWKRFVTWREGDREVRRIVDAIEDAKRKWIAQGKKRRDLLEGRLLKDGRRSLKEAPAEVFGAQGFIRKSLWWRRSELIGLLVIPVLALGLPTEYFWREEVVRQDYDRIERLGNGDERERLSVINLAGGCWTKKLHGQFPVYFRERFFGNCRSLESAKLNNANLRNINLSNTNLYRANLSNTRFYGTNLSGNKFMSADLSGADFNNTNLTNANLQSAKLNGARFSKANLENAQFGCFEIESLNNMARIGYDCVDMKDIEWNEGTNWKGIQGWESVINIPLKLKQQLGLK